jgi:hypothetical protein
VVSKIICIFVIGKPTENLAFVDDLNWGDRLKREYND